VAAGAADDRLLTTTWRSQQKAERGKQLLRAAARMIAQRGYLGVRLEDLGSAVGISGPAVYRHFDSKEALLVELLTDVSQRLLDGATGVVASFQDPRSALEALVDFHLNFALTEPDLIRVQDRDLASLPPDALRQVRRTQRRYVEIWVSVLQEVDGGLTEPAARVKAHAAFGLINSTPHSANSASLTQTRAVLRTMTLAALGLLPTVVPPRRR
jgi:AcrR family transcriptional regulator